MKSSQVLGGLFKDPNRQILLIRPQCISFDSVHVVFGCHLFLKFSKIDISEIFRSLVFRRIETEQENDQDEDEWRHAHGRKIARAMMASRTPSNGLVMANQNETFQPWP